MKKIYLNEKDFEVVSCRCCGKIAYGEQDVRNNFYVHFTTNVKKNEKREKIETTKCIKCKTEHNNIPEVKEHNRQRQYQYETEIRNGERFVEREYVKKSENKKNKDNKNNKKYDTIIKDINEMNEIVIEEIKKYYEGKRYMKDIVSNEPIRNKELAKDYKNDFAKKHNGKIYCEVCGQYHDVPEILEVHHKTKISEYININKDYTTFDDVILLCPTCHKLIHLKGSIEEVEQYYKLKINN